jgi:hypothetical protein
MIYHRCPGVPSPQPALLAAHSRAFSINKRQPGQPVGAHADPPQQSVAQRAALG